MSARNTIRRLARWVRGAPPGSILMGLALVLVLAGVGAMLVISLHLSSALAHRNRSDDIAGCRAAYRAELIDGPTYEALKASAVGDHAAAQAAIDRGNPARYGRLLNVSRRDPGRFLATCRRENPGG